MAIVPLTLLSPNTLFIQYHRNIKHFQHLHQHLSLRSYLLRYFIINKNLNTQLVLIILDAFYHLNILLLIKTKDTYVSFIRS